MIFKELPEEYWPQNIQYPERIEVSAQEFTDIMNNASASTCSYVTGAPLMYIFAEARHVEFTDAYTGQLLFPPEMIMVPILKSMARSKSPFVFCAHYGFREAASNFPYQCQPNKDRTYNRRFFAPLELTYHTGFEGEYHFKDLLTRKLAKQLGVHRYNSRIGVTTTNAFEYQLQRFNVARLFVHDNRHFYFVPETSDENK